MLLYGANSICGIVSYFYILHCLASGQTQVKELGHAVENQGKNIQYNGIDVVIIMMNKQKTEIVQKLNYEFLHLLFN